MARKRFVNNAIERTDKLLRGGANSVSESAEEHANQTMLAIRPNVNLLESLRRRYMDEVVAAQAMFLALEKACKEGHVDTHVLAELSGQSELQSIAPE